MRHRPHGTSLNKNSKSFQACAHFPFTLLPHSSIPPRLQPLVCVLECGCSGERILIREGEKMGKNSLSYINHDIWKVSNGRNTLLPGGNTERIKGERKSKVPAVLGEAWHSCQLEAKSCDLKSGDDVLMDGEKKQRELPRREHKQLWSKSLIWLHEWRLKKMRSLCKETPRYSQHNSTTNVYFYTWLEHKGHKILSHP